MVHHIVQKILHFFKQAVLISKGFFQEFLSFGVIPPPEISLRSIGENLHANRKTRCRRNSFANFAGEYDLRLLKDFDKGVYLVMIKASLA